MSVTQTASSLSVHKLHPHVGAEVKGVTLSDPLPDDIFAQIRAAFNEHSVLVFRDQRINDAQQVAFSERFGALEETTFKVAADNPFVYSLSNVDERGEVLKRSTERRTFLDVNSRWHTDSSFRAVPAMASVLSAREVPEHEKSNTEFASMRVGYDTLPAERKEEIQDKVCVHDYAYSLSLFGERHGVKKEELDSLPPVEHHLVRTHPETGKQNLYVSGHIERVKNMDPAKGRALVEQLLQWCTRDDYVYSHQWSKHDVVMWDNRCALHRVTHVPFKERRIMHRTTIAGVKPGTQNP